MKKVILLVAVIAGIIAMANIQDVKAVNEQPAITIILGDDGFVDVKLENLSAEVQASINALTEEYDVNELKYNAEKQLTKVKLTKKDDQSKKTIYFDAEGKEVEKDRATENEPQRIEQEQQPSAEMSYGMQDNGFVSIKFEDLSEKVQEAVRTIANDYEISSLQYNSEKKLTEVKGTSKEDQSERIFYLDEEGKEVSLDTAPEQTEAEAPMLF